VSPRLKTGRREHLDFKHAGSNWRQNKEGRRFQRADLGGRTVYGLQICSRLIAVTAGSNPGESMADRLSSLLCVEPVAASMTRSPAGCLFGASSGNHNNKVAWAPFWLLRHRERDREGGGVPMELFVPIYQTIRRHIPDDANLNAHLPSNFCTHSECTVFAL
jgi:hypothetical protein